MRQGTMALVLKTTALSVLLNYSTHVITSHGYHMFCVPASVWDIVRSLVTTVSPTCSFLLSTMQMTQSNYAALVTTGVASAMAGLLKS